ncbi:head GIN domain-containing protein [uncultured Alistipes sp.]|jgi:hypothetical protein|uniref:head GIN domain-containing protein n=1 Tax=uncultured Alistipes sp. TaxID=538949 RepID=UPI0025DA13A4|nr:head GIN domain-containing protein [uncultured Alistipes sp.]
MKRILLIVVLLCAMFTATAYFISLATPSTFFGFGAGDGLRGSGDMTTRTIVAPDFDRIEAARAVKVVITDEATDKIVIEADDNVIDFVVVKVKDGRLFASIDNSIKRLSNAEVTVTIPSNGRIRSLEASSAAKISSDVLLTADKFSLDASSAAKIRVSIKATDCNIEASSAAKIDARVEAVNCRVEASSASKVILKGSAEKGSAELNSAAKLSAGEFVVADYTVEASSAGKAVVNCSGHLRASASSGGRVSYTGDCDTNISKSSGGSVGRN